MSTALSYVMALVAAACVASRFPPLAARLPAFADDVAFVVAGVALGVVVVAEARMKRGTVGPLWMRVKAPPRLALALLLSFITTVIAQTLKVSLGPVDPTFPTEAPFATNALWFFMFTIGFAGIGMMGAPGVFLPVLHPVARAMRQLPLGAAAAILGVVGAGVGIAFGRVLVLPAVSTVVTRAQDWCDANAQLVTGVMLAATIVPALLPSKDDDDEKPSDDDH